MNQSVKKAVGYIAVFFMIICFTGLFITVSLFNSSLDNWWLSVRLEGLSKSSNGGDVLIDGILGGEAGDGPFRSDAQRNSMVLYKVERWDVSCNSHGDCSGGWEEFSAFFPEKITLNGVAVKLNRAESVAFDKVPVRTGVIKDGSGMYADGLCEGAVRLIGYGSSGKVTLLGKNSFNGVFKVERVFSGSSDQYLSYTQTRSSSDIKFGIICLIMTIVSGLLFMVFQKLEQA